MLAVCRRSPLPPTPLPAPAGAAAAQLAALDKAHTMRQLGVGTPANSILGILCDCDAAGSMGTLHAGGRAGGQPEEGEEYDEMDAA